jgi:malate dehydrogenase (oxaloacetate-decarboxylating)(NADP+)
MALYTKDEALAYHELPRRGKVEVLPVKPCATQKDLSMAYSPGVAEACKAIHAKPELVNTYTGRANLVAVVSNGTAVLGLGNIGPKAGKPVMEGKGILFKMMADIDCYDINLDVNDPDLLIAIV